MFGESFGCEHAGGFVASSLCHFATSSSPMRSAIIFDFDGVIVHSEPLHMRAILQAFGPLGVAFDEATYYAKYVALSDKDLFPMIARDFGIAWNGEIQERTLRAKWQAYDALVDSGEVGVFAGTLALIAAARESRVPIAVCSAATRRDIERSLLPLGLLPAFGTIVSADDVRVSKPDPACYALAAKRLGFAPSLCVAIEDSAGGMRSALDAGLACIAVCHTLPAGRLAGATRIVQSSAELTLAEVLAV
jgi:beta-phosphoglucomutase